MQSRSSGDRTTRVARRILVVDDEASIVDAVSTALRYEGYEVAAAYSGKEALAAVSTFKPDLIVLDVMLPDVDGVEISRQLRARGSETAILFLTARDDTDDKIEALQAGGDDYMTKPFSLAEVIVRTQTILRRTTGSATAAQLEFSDLRLDEATREVTRGGTPITLTATEFELLRYLMQNPRRVISKGQILENVWRYDFGGGSSLVETYISYLRKKLDATGPSLIKTVRLVGYMLDAPE